MEPRNQVSIKYYLRLLTDATRGGSKQQRAAPATIEVLANDEAADGVSLDPETVRLLDETVILKNSLLDVRRRNLEVEYRYRGEF